MDHVLVVPCYNEASRWRTDYWVSLLGLQDVHWVFVDDGSTDETSLLADEACRFGSADVIRLPRNRGKAEAVRVGLCRALDCSRHGTAGIGFMDADGAFSCSDVERLLAVYQTRVSSARAADCAWSARVALAGREIHRSTARHYLGRAVATLVSLGEPGFPYDTQSGLKLFAPTETLRQCLDAPFETRWLFELELLLRWRTTTHVPMRVWEEPLASWREVPGSTITSREAARIARELYLIKRRQAQARRGATHRTRELNDRSSNGS